jgi:hypothetical protein
LDAAKAGFRIWRRDYGRSSGCFQTLKSIPERRRAVVFRKLEPGFQLVHIYFPHAHDIQANGLSLLSTKPGGLSQALSLPLTIESSKFNGDFQPWK